MSPIRRTAVALEAALVAGEVAEVEADAAS
jgi:hypothetical protein